MWALAHNPHTVHLPWEEGNFNVFVSASLACKALIVAEAVAAHQSDDHAQDEQGCDKQDHPAFIRRQIKCGLEMVGAFCPDGC